MLTKKIRATDSARLDQLRPIAARYGKQSNYAERWKANTGGEMFEAGALDELKAASEAASAEIEAILQKYR